MKLRKWKTKKKGYSIIINEDVEICISYEDFKNKNEPRLYFVDYFDDSSDYEEGWDYNFSDNFDELCEVLEYLENNFEVNKKILNKIKFK